MKLIFCFLFFCICVESRGDFITFTSEVNSGGSPKIVIDNRSDIRWLMVQATFDFTGTPVVLSQPTSLPFGNYGAYQTANTAGGQASFAGFLQTTNLIRFDFAGMTSGDGYGVTIGLGDVRGSQMNGATIEALFRSIETGEERSLKYVYDSEGSGRSFPAFASASVPEPGSAGIGVAILVAVAFRFRRRIV